MIATGHQQLIKKEIYSKDRGLEDSLVPKIFLLEAE